MVIIKTKEELDKMRTSGYIASRVLRSLELTVEPGITTKYLDKRAEALIRGFGGKPAFLGYKNYPFTICASINEEVIHGLPSKRKLKEGDIISIDLGVIYKEYYSDTAMTIPVGKISEPAKKLISTTKECLYKAINKATINTYTGILSNTIQITALAEGFNIIRNYGGHGVGKELHEDPQILNYGSANSGIMLKPGMVIAIEPLLVEGSYSNRRKGRWTVITQDRGLAAHFEHTVAITENGPEIFTERW